MMNRLVLAGDADLAKSFFFCTFILFRFRWKHILSVFIFFL